MVGGDEVFDRTVLEVKREFDFGAWDVGAMRFKDRQLTEMANDEITVDMEHFQLVLSQIDRIVQPFENIARCLQISVWPTARLL